jgi:hypothetical protein
MDPHTIGDVLVDGLRKGVGFLEDHTHLRAQRHDIHFPAIDIHPFQLDLAAYATPLDGVVHSIQAAYKRRFSTTRGADHGDDFIATDIERETMDRALVTVVDIDIATGHTCVLHELLADRRAILPVYRGPGTGRSADRGSGSAALRNLRLFYDGIHRILLWDF